MLILEILSYTLNFTYEVALVVEGVDGEELSALDLPLQSKSKLYLLIYNTRM